MHLFIWNELMAVGGIDFYSMIDSSTAKFIAYSSHSSVVCVHRLFNQLLFIPSEAAKHNTNAELWQIELIRQLLCSMSRICNHIVLYLAMVASRHDLHALSIAPVQLVQFAICIGTFYSFYCYIFFGIRLKIKFDSIHRLLFINGNSPKPEKTLTLSECEFIKAAATFASTVATTAIKWYRKANEKHTHSHTHLWGVLLTIVLNLNVQTTHWVCELSVWTRNCRTSVCWWSEKNRNEKKATTTHKHTHTMHARSTIKHKKNGLFIWNKEQKSTSTTQPNIVLFFFIFNLLFFFSIESHARWSRCLFASVCDCAIAWVFVHNCIYSVYEN